MQHMQLEKANVYVLGKLSEPSSHAFVLLKVYHGPRDAAGRQSQPSIVRTLASWQDETFLCKQRRCLDEKGRHCTCDKLWYNL